MSTYYTAGLLLLTGIIAPFLYPLTSHIPVFVSAVVAAVGLVILVWWHWNQFGVEYRTSTWQEQLRNYASYVILLVVILLSYAFYVFAWSNSPLQGYVTKAASTIRDAGRKLSSQVASAATRTTSAINNVLPSPPLSPSNLTNRNIFNRNKTEPAYLD